jgi:phage shock protein PspC (stress-responsive transcriptional regulator)
MDQTHAVTDPAPSTGDRGPNRLRRAQSHRMLAGVARGIATRFDVDVSLVRVAFVVLACAWGLGLVIYAAMWALVPRDSGDGVDVADEAGEPTEPWLSYLLLAGVLAFGLLVVSSWWGGPRWGGAVGLLWLVLLFGLLAVVLIAPSRKFRLRRVLGLLVLGSLSLVILLVGGLLALVAWTGVPLSGGVGQRVFAPTTIGQLQSSYRLGAGDLTVDLRRINFADARRPIHLTASVAVGIVTVDVPPSVMVSVNAHSGVGTVITSAPSLSAFGAPTQRASKGSSSPLLILTVDAGLGKVELIRSSADAPG